VSRVGNANDLASFTGKRKTVGIPSFSFSSSSSSSALFFEIATAFNYALRIHRVIIGKRDTDCLKRGIGF